MASETLSSPVQRYSLGLDRGKPRLFYDMRGEVVKFPDHLRALATERRLAEDRVASERQRVESEQPEAEKPSHTEFHAARGALSEAVTTLRKIGWGDGDIIFAAGLDPETASTFIAAGRIRGGAGRCRLSSPA
jgi:hypothetical protein